MRIAVAQTDPVVGAFETNTRKILDAYALANQAGARLLLTPELGVSGYPPHDLVDRPEIFERNERALGELEKATKGKGCALAVGYIARNPLSVGRAAQNVIAILENGKRDFTQAKTLLPTYDVFDEARYFEPATEWKPWICDGKRVGVAICEDLWGSDRAFGRRLYGKNPIDTYAGMNLDLLVSGSASPYVWGKRAHRETLHAEIAKKLKVPIVYVNQVGATDEILFDGASFALDQTGKLAGRLKAFETAFAVFDAGTGRWDEAHAISREDTAPEEIEVLRRALVTGIRDYFARTGFQIAVIGLSGGIDSAVVAVLAAEALGAKNVLGVAMPSQYSSGHSLEDADSLAKNLGTAFEVRPIKFLFSTLSRELSERRGELVPLALENLQSRLRGIVLMTLSNHYRALVLTTGNKSELAVGYCTLYGDMCGALAPLGDVLKTRVYELARHLNQIAGKPVIPERTLSKAPSAELKPGQTDQDSLPPYDLLDELLVEYVENAMPVSELRTRFGKKLPLDEILRLIELNEFKRRQAAPALKISTKAFGIGRRIPIAKKWDT